jgi:hypothetical protein
VAFGRRIRCPEVNRAAIVPSKLGETGADAQRPYPCRVACNKSFSNRASRKRHEKTHDRRTWVCSVCAVRMSHVSLLKLHMRRVHGVPVEIESRTISRHVNEDGNPT